jgi:hypothetical protein
VYQCFNVLMFEQYNIWIIHYAIHLMNLKFDVQFYSLFDFLMYQGALYQYINLNNVISCCMYQIIMHHHKCNVSTLQTYSSCIEFVGVDLKWMLEWHVWFFKLSKKWNLKAHQGAWNER